MIADDPSFAPDPWVRHGSAQMSIVRLLDIDAAIELRVGGQGHMWAWRADAPPDKSRKGTCDSAENAKSAALTAARALHQELRTNSTHRG